MILMIVRFVSVEKAVLEVLEPTFSSISVEIDVIIDSNTQLLNVNNNMIILLQLSWGPNSI